jgi:hypothetical protein
VHGIPSHGIAMTQDETEIWISDNGNRYARIFDATVLPPTLKTSIKLRDEPGRVTFGIDRTLAYLILPGTSRSAGDQFGRGAR